MLHSHQTKNNQQATPTRKPSSRLWRCAAVVLLMAALHASALSPHANAMDAFPSARVAQYADADEAMVFEVAARLLDQAQAVPEFQWPPKILVPKDEDLKSAGIDPSDPNAFATLLKRPGKPQPIIVVNRALLKRIIEGDRDRLALVLGHELAHITLKHVRIPAGPQPTPFMKTLFTREKELAADQAGALFALGAGYSLRNGLDGLAKLMELGFEYSPLEGLSADHPPIKERLAQLDKKQSTLWHSMSAFHNGTVFLTIEQYKAAENCFRAVTREFPDCYEGWANLGYALLMQYCDGLEPADLRQFDIGHIVVGGFYARPKSLESKLKGIDQTRWNEAVDALKQALALKPDLTLAKANLGVAYLVHPKGKQIEQATRYLREAVAAAETDSTLDPLSRAVVAINAGVADLAGNQAQQCEIKLNKAEQGARNYRLVQNAVKYNRGLLLAQSPDSHQQRAAAVQLENYLSAASASSAWWRVGYDRYAQLCKAQGLTCKSEQDFAGNRPAPLRTLTTVELAKGLTLSLTDSTSDVKRRLGNALAVPVVAGTDFVRLRSVKYGVSVLATGQVLAIALNSPLSPAINVRALGLGTQTTAIRVGMTRQALEQIVGADAFDARLYSATIPYRFYPELGLAVRFNLDKVAELVIVQLPREAYGPRPPGAARR